MVNGKRSTTIRPSRGLKKGDPLSPYLFIVVAHVLSRLMKSQVARGVIEGIQPRRECMTIHHLYFADDTPFFFKGSMERAKYLKDTLEVYCAASGQMVNFAKSCIFFNSAMDEDLKRDITPVFEV